MLGQPEGIHGANPVVRRPTANVMIAHAVTTMVIFGLAACTTAVAAEIPSQEQAFLETAIEDQELEITLGKLALKNASNREVKQLGARILEDEQKAHEQLRALASKEGIALPKEVDNKTKEKQREFSHYVGIQFDYAYIAYMLQDHSIEIRTLEENAKRLTDSNLKKWATSTLPILKAHVEKAHAVASLIGLTEPGAIPGAIR